MIKITVEFPDGSTETLHAVQWIIAVTEAADITAGPTEMNVHCTPAFLTKVVEVYAEEG